MRPKDLDDEHLTDEDEDGFNDDGNGSHSDYKAPDLKAAGIKYQLSGMYESWFLDYASYVILDRAVPHMDDGLNPVQRRIMHTMKLLEDGRYNKVANIVGSTMKFHPHGDASIYGALVQLGQKDLLVDCQGNWGNIYTGDGAAAARYIEARVSKFALDVAFNHKTTDWKMSYDGRNEEPVTLPVKFPLLLAQGAEGIAVTLSSLIMPHNFNEIIDAAVLYLKNEPFQLFPDFPTGGLMDVSRYNDGERGGRLVVRASISKLDNKTLVINDIPYGETTHTVISSIIKAKEDGKINVVKIDDDTSNHVEILIHLDNKTSSDKTIDALYAFTKCQKSISPVCCVIKDKNPVFTNVSNLLTCSVDRTMSLLKRELEIERAELREQLFFLSLVQWFIDNRIYKEKKFEDSPNIEATLAFIDSQLEPLKPKLLRAVTNDDLLRLLEIKMARILKFNKKDNEDKMAALNENVAKVNDHLAHLVEYTIDWYLMLKNKYGKQHPRLTEIRNFENISASKVAEANQKLYVDTAEGFIGTGLKKDSSEFVSNCSDIDDVIIFFKDGKFKVVKVADKLYVGKNILYLNIFKKKDTRTVYNVVYHDGRGGAYYYKRFSVPSITHDKEYDLTQGKPNSTVTYFTANLNAEAEVIRVYLRPRLRLKKSSFDRDFGELAVKGRQSRGNLLTKNEIHHIELKRRGGSTMGGRKVWFDADVLRLNYEERGNYLGEFFGDDSILVVQKNGDYYTCSFDDNNHFNENWLRIEKFDSNKVWTAVLYDANEDNKYIKRFLFEPTQKTVNFLGDNPKSLLILLTDTCYPRLEVHFAGAYADKEPIELDAESYIGVKGLKAKGKRINNQWLVGDVVELEPLRLPESDADEGEESDENQSDVDENSETDVADSDADKSSSTDDEDDGLPSLF